MAMAATDIIVVRAPIASGAGYAIGIVGWYGYGIAAINTGTSAGCVARAIVIAGWCGPTDASATLSVTNFGPPIR